MVVCYLSHTISDGEPKPQCVSGPSGAERARAQSGTAEMSAVFLAPSRSNPRVSALSYELCEKYFGPDLLEHR
ncbi:hypothetical protein AAFF_G00013040 [Aldrovandia affinis]|uniref:Uncharacterized protein n=1 Tax=Aldrovandia affinis TaxID=143900 RepID=A0AAD7S909_9TELE|nr:hypothetical protein AAFF_G00013040 [Aldrovandia affinis]